MRRIVLALALLLGFELPTFATTYVPVADGDLARQAAVIVEARVLAVEASPVERWIATDYQVEIEAVTRGFVPGSQIVVRVPGGGRPDGTRSHIFGAPRFSLGEQVLLFLRPGQDGTYRILHFFLGAFHIVERGGRALAVRDLREAVEISLGERARHPARQPEGVRELGRFRAWLATGEEDAEKAPYGDYFVALPREGVTQRADSFTVFSSEGTEMRWPDFDSGGSLTYRAHEAGLPGVPGGGFADVPAALAAWSDDPDSFVDLVYGGTTPATAGLTAPDGINAVLFEDPNDEIGTPFQCGSGGVLGIGGVEVVGTHTFRGKTFLTVVEGDVVLNKGTGCFLNTFQRAEEVFAHEVGHSLAFGHSSTDGQALMWPSIHGDGRGATLSQDDRDALCYLYSEGICEVTGGGDPAPVAPSGLVATAVSPTAIRLTWQDNADDETLFEVERLELTWTKIGEVGADVTVAESPDLTPGRRYTYRVRARNGAGASRYSNTASATTPTVEPPTAPPPTAPSHLEVEALSATALRVYWRDQSRDESSFRLEAATAGGSFTFLRNVAADRQSTVVTGLMEDTLYTLRIQAVGQGGGSAFSNPATGRTFEGGVARPEAPEYLLAIPRAAGQVLLRWQVVPGVRYDVEQRILDNPFQPLETGTGEPGELLLEGMAAGVPYTFRVRAVEDDQPSGYSPRARTTLVRPGDPCVADASTACLLGGRFQVQTWWHDPRGDTGGTGGATARSDQSGTFWFFGPGIVELLVKILDGRVLTDHYWVFYGALSDVEYWVAVTDTETGFLKGYHNPPGNLCGVPDTLALPGDGLRIETGPVEAAVLFPSLQTPATGAVGKRAGVCTPGPRTLCLLEGRIQVEADFAAPDGAAGPAQAVPDASNTGFFWFFNADNLELAVKVLDGRSVNGHYWVFWGSLSDVHYTLTVTDTETGARRTYANPQSNFCGGADIEAL